MQKVVMSLLFMFCLAIATPCLSTAAEKKEAAAVHQVNINTATAKELEMLPGIGKITAEEIVKYRAAGNKFAVPDDLLKVKGVGAKTLEKIRGMIVIK